MGTQKKNTTYPTYGLDDHILWSLIIFIAHLLLKFSVPFKYPSSYLLNLYFSVELFWSLIYGCRVNFKTTLLSCVKNKIRLNGDFLQSFIEMRNRKLWLQKQTPLRFGRNIIWKLVTRLIWVNSCLLVEKNAL